jgi:hypothetical protein
MKNQFLFAFVIILGLQISFAQTSNPPVGVQVTPATPGFEAPAIVTSNFTAKYPNSNPSWRMINDNYAADFIDLQTLRTTVVYDKFGNLLYEDKAATPSKLPKQIKNYHEKNFPDTKLEVRSQQDQKGNLFYYMTHDKDTISFDQSGKKLNSTLKFSAEKQGEK